MYSHQLYRLLDGRDPAALDTPCSCVYLTALKRLVGAGMEININGVSRKSMALINVGTVFLFGKGRIP